MTGHELFERTLTLINERDSAGERGDISDLSENAAGLINTLCNMLWSSDELLRGQRVEHWRFVPSDIKSLDDEILLHPALCHTALPYALAYLLLLEEDRERAESFYKLFREAEGLLLSRSAKAKRHTVEDVYFAEGS